MEYISKRHSFAEFKKRERNAKVKRTVENLMENQWVGLAIGFVVAVFIWNGILV